MGTVLEDKFNGRLVEFPDRYARFVLSQPDTGWKRPAKRRKPAPDSNSGDDD